MAGRLNFQLVLHTCTRFSIVPVMVVSCVASERSFVGCCTLKGLAEFSFAYERVMYVLIVILVYLTF